MEDIAMAFHQLEQYKKWLSKEQQIDDKYIIIHFKWFEHWKRYVGIAKSDEETVTDPGPIDFTELADPASIDHSNQVQLRADAIEGNDYTFIPYELYEELVKIHKKEGSEIIRKVIPQREVNTVIETFLVPLRLRESRSARAKIKQIYRSRRTPIEELKRDICTEYCITPNSSYCLYSSIDENGNDWKPIDEHPSLVLEDIDITKNAYIIYEQKPLSTWESLTRSLMGTTSHIPGLCGLSNLGNTCFMNSALQCLSNVPSLTTYFLHNQYKEHINRENPLGMKGNIAQAYGKLMHEMWSGRTSSCSPRSLKRSVARYAPQFSGYTQQDSQEFMSFLLDGLHGDLNLVKQNPYAQKKDDNGKADDFTLANEQWDYYRKRNQSKIHDIFHGQIKSVVQCLTCKTKGRTFDPICFLSLPLPLPGKTKIRTFKIEYVRLNGQIKTYSIKSNEHSHMSNLVEEFCDRFQLKHRNVSKSIPMDTDGASTSNENNQDEDEIEDDEEEEKEDFTKAPGYDGHQPRPDFILPAEVYNHRIHLQYPDNHLLTCILERDQIVFYEVPDSLKKANGDTILMPCVFREENSRQNFGYPIYLSIPRRDCKGKDIQEALKKIIGNFLPLLASDQSDKPLYIASCLMNQNYYQTTKALESILSKRIDFTRIDVSLIVDVASSVVEQYKKKQREEEEKRLKKDHFSSSSSIDNAIEKCNQQKESIRLEDCFKDFTKKEILSPNDLWNCPKCKEMRRASKKIDLWLLPKVLIVQLKRFHYTRHFRDKINLFVDCPLRDLDLSQFVLNPSEKSKAKYDLIAVSNHMGGLDGGHYTAHAKNVNDHKWHTFDDSWVSEVSEDNVISKAAYILIYQRQQ